MAALQAESEAKSKSLAELQAEKDEVERRLAAIEGNLQTTREEIDRLRKQRAEVEKRLQAHRAINEWFKKMIDAGKDRSAPPRSIR